MRLPPRQSVLFLTNCEHGQANVVLAIAYEFLLRDEFDIHIASYPQLARRVDALNQEFANNNPKAGLGVPKVTFHELAGISMMDNIKNSHIGWPHKTGISNTVQSYTNLAKAIVGGESSNYLDTYDSCLAVIESVQPVATAVDPLFMPGTDAAQTAKVEYLQLFPTSLYEICADRQPYGAILWKYPAVASGFPFPIPLRLIPANLYLVAQLIHKFLFSQSVATLTKARKAHGLTTAPPLASVHDRVQLCPSLPEIDFTYSVIPSTVIPCGPILLPTIPVAQTDLGMSNWLTRGPTILINMGTHHMTDAPTALGMALAVSSMCKGTSHAPKLQVLWKLKYDWKSDPDFESAIRSELDEDRIRITEWLIPETIAILSTGNIAAFVHHGGANSYYEACHAGIPQVVLPVWYDTFQFAAKVEYLGLGVYGNKQSAPGVTQKELTDALATVLTDAAIIAKARIIGELCRKTIGREVACDKMVELARQDE